MWCLSRQDRGGGKETGSQPSIGQSVPNVMTTPGGWQRSGISYSLGTFWMVGWFSRWNSSITWETLLWRWRLHFYVLSFLQMCFIQSDRQTVHVESPAEDQGVEVDSSRSVSMVRLQGRSVQYRKVTTSQLPGTMNTNDTSVTQRRLSFLTPEHRQCANVICVSWHHRGCESHGNSGGLNHSLPQPSIQVA